MRAPLLTFLTVAALAAPATAGDPPNVLLVMLDDVGVDRVAAYGEHPDPGNTPTLDALAAGGVLFRNAWAAPSCSPGRSAALTGRLGFRTGIGRTVVSSPQFSDADGLPLAETTLAELLAGTHTSFAVGKWHLSIGPGPLTGPLDQGFATHRGSFANLSNTLLGDAYTNWTKSVDGVPAPETAYATTDSVDDALALVRAATEPWFLYLALNAPHGPVHKPPQALHSYALPDSVADNIPVHVQAMIEAADTELGRLLASMAPAVLDNTLILVAGDNGTFGSATTPPFDPAHAKGTIYEGGLNVPLIIAGPGVASGECDGLVHLSDIYATVAEAVGVPLVGGEDSLSLAPYLADPSLPSLRDMVYAEAFTPNGLGTKASWEQAVRDERFKLLRFHDAPVASPTREEFYDLQTDPFETTDLLTAGPLSPAAQASLDALRGTLLDLLGSWKQAGSGLAGVQGLPELLGGGTLEPGAPTTLDVRSGPPLGTTFVVIGYDLLHAPFKGGSMVPAPAHFLIMPLDVTGAISLAFTWPLDLPSALDVWWQGWQPDPAGVFGFSATNALVSSTP